MNEATEPQSDQTKQTAKPESDGQLQKSGNEKDKDKSSKADGEADTIIPEELLNELPPEYRRELISIISRSGPMENPIAKKITAEHITTLLSNANEEDQRDRVERNDERNHNFRILVTCIITVLITCGLFMYFEEKDMLKYIIGAIFGFGGGFGVGKWGKDKSK